MKIRILILPLLLLTAAAHADDPASQLARYAAQAGKAPDAANGQRLFTSRHGRDWSCASCHGAAPVAPGQHAGTGKPIAPLAPAFNGQRFNDPAKTEKWFRRNCNDVLGRECLASEKADVLSWLLSFERKGG